MISLKDNLPVIQLSSGQVIAFEREWLVRSLAQAAARAGYAKWWLAGHVAESVTSYLHDQQEVNVLPVEQLARAVQSVLQVIGYAEVAQHFAPAAPRVQVSLVELAREAGTGYELAFFDMLGRRIQELCREKNSCFELLGLEPCVKLLRSRKSWSRDCDALRSEIVSFAREQTGTAAVDREVTFSLV
jgi:hypothetical protein